MAYDIEVTFADGGKHVYKGAPDSVTPDMVLQRAQQDFAGKGVTAIDRRAAAAAPTAAPTAAPAPAPRTTSGLDLSMVPEQFKSGVAGMQQGFYMTGAKRAAENLQILDRIDKGEAVPEAQDPLGYQQMNPTQRAAARAELESYFPKNVAKAVAAPDEQSSGQPRGAEKRQRLNPK